MPPNFRSVKAAVAQWSRCHEFETSTTNDPPCRQRYTLNLSRAEASFGWCGMVVRRGGCQLRCRPLHLTKIQITWSVAKSPRVAEQCDVNIHSIRSVNK
ncbi:hypothetical protein TNCV_3999251 [Trichonephila clavipes]|nr:hypothetical protein TNCV_3999251 [Trichonephila clavipes]